MTQSLIRAACITVLYAGITGMPAESTAQPAITPPVRINLGEAVRDDAKTAMVRDVLPGEIPGIRSTMISLAPGIVHHEPSSTEEDRVVLVLSGRGEITADGKRHPVAGETVVHFPVGWSMDVKANDPEGLDLLVLRLTLTPVDREDLAAHADLNRVAYIKAFEECEAYTEAIKSPKTVSRTLLPKDIVPRMAVGTVETTGPDKVSPHRHPMLEQYFLGLEGNDIIVQSDSVRTSLKANELFHIPQGSNHGAEVAEGRKLYYVWMDFFQDRKGLEWLNGHKPLAPTKKQ
jgi:quercetin dioxygenase-like cupin family protein